MKETKCGYCENYSKMLKPGTSNRKAKFGCPVRRRKVLFDKKACKYFKPRKYFYCDNHGEQLNFVSCLARRLNLVALPAYEKCKKCRQFEQDIGQIVQNYIVEGVAIATIPESKLSRKNSVREERKLKRRSSGRVLKRRNQKPRKLKRRKK